MTEKELEEKMKSLGLPSYSLYQIKRKWRVPTIFKLYRWQWFISDMKFRTLIRWMMRTAWFTRSEIGEPRIKKASRSIINTWKMKDE